MKKARTFRNLLAMLLAIVMVFSLCACDTTPDVTNPSGSTGSTGSTENTGSTDPVVPDNELTGTVKLGYTADWDDYYKALVAAFNEKYPNVTVEMQVIQGSMYGQYEKMAALAAGNNLPDVCVGSEHFGDMMMRGWLYPLNNLIEEDPDSDSIIEQALENFSYNGTVFGLPMQMQFNSIGVNLDLLEQLNMDAPDYDWTIDEFVYMAKKATTQEYSGINYIYNSTNPTWGLDNKLMSSMIPDGYHQYGYSFENHNVDMTINNAWVASNKLLQELSSVYGLVSDDLKYTGGTVSDYEKKFGEGADALLSGKVLFGNHSTWEYGMYMKTNFKFDFYPMPTDSDIEQRIQTHFDFAYMTSNVTEENRDAAYALLKWITYGEGCLTRIEQNMKAFEEDPISTKIYIPASADPEVIAAFDATTWADGIKYMYHKVIEEPECIMVSDCDKIIPNYWSDIVQFREQAMEKVQNGTDPASLINDFQNKVSSAMADSWDYFETTMKKNLDKFYENHPWEKK